MNRVLDVYLHDRYAGKLTQEKTGNSVFIYDEKYVLLPEAKPISVCMPVQLRPHEGQSVKAFFSGLLPDDMIRHKLARYLGISEKNPFSLLEVIGGECAGALSVFPEGQIPPLPKEEDIEILSEQQLTEILDLLKRRPLLAGNDNIRLSLAGAQDKIAVRLIKGEIALVKGTSPTSHILKPMIEGLSQSVQNEYFCLTLAKRIGLNIPDVAIRWMGDVPYFLIERYDRHLVNGEVKRLHQEDFCQALGVLPEFKYEREGGPSILQCLSLLKQHSETPGVDSIAFIKTLIFNYLIGNSDAHGKNFALLYRNKKPILAPFYDLMSTSVYPSLSKKMAMKIGNTYDPEKTFIRHWNQIIPNTSSAQRMLKKDLKNISEKCLFESVRLKDEFKNQGHEFFISENICSLIKKRAQHIFDMLNLKKPLFQQ